MKRAVARGSGQCRRGGLTYESLTRGGGGGAFTRSGWALFTLSKRDASHLDRPARLPRSDAANSLRAIGKGRRKLSAVGLMLSVIAFWNATYMQAVVKHCAKRARLRNGPPADIQTLGSILAESVWAISSVRPRCQTRRAARSARSHPSLAIRPEACRHSYTGLGPGGLTCPPTPC